MQKLFIIILLYFFNLSISLSASFDCYNASTKTEIAICNNEQLSNKDNEMGKVYKEIINYLKNKINQYEGYKSSKNSLSEFQKSNLKIHKENLKKIQNFQKNWIKKEQSKCKSDVPCLFKKTDLQIFVLKTKFMNMSIDDRIIIVNKNNKEVHPHHIPGVQTCEPNRNIGYESNFEVRKNIVQVLPCIIFFKLSEQFFINNFAIELTGIFKPKRICDRDAAFCGDAEIKLKRFFDEKIIKIKVKNNFRLFSLNECKKKYRYKNLPPYWNLKNKKKLLDGDTICSISQNYIYDIKNFITWFPPIWYDKDIIYYNKLKQYIRIKVGTVHTKNPYKTNSISVEHKYNYYYFTSTNEDFYLEKFEENRDDL